MTDSELHQLLDDLSLQEKIDQMMQLPGELYQEGTQITGPIQQMGISRKSMEEAGSVLSVTGAQTIRKIQTETMKKQPHHIPMLFMLDVINGYHTIFPIPLGQGAMFDPELSKSCAQMAAREASVAGIHVTFSPMLDLVRDARWGRVMESTGEDPFLNACYAKAMVEGYQGDSLKEPYRLAACVKHFAAYGAPTAGREYNTVELSEHTLREFYLPAYHAAIDAKAAMVMTSFNTFNGVPATGNQLLMQQILRKEWDFDGVLITDYSAIQEMIAHGYCEDRADAAETALKAGVDIDMVSGIYSEQLASLVRLHPELEEKINEAVFRILKLKNELGLFENPFKDLDEEKEKTEILTAENRALARKAAEESFVLLQNKDQILPLSSDQKIALIGPYADNKRILGSWSFCAPIDAVTTIAEAAAAEFSEFSVHPGCTVLGTEPVPAGFGNQIEEPTDLSVLENYMEEAVQAAHDADTVVLCLGEHRMQSGEACSRSSIQLPAIQQELLERVAEVNDRIVCVVFSGRPLDLRRVSEKAKAILEVWMPGTEGGPAIVRTLLGKNNPQGKLSMSFPYSVGQVPVFYNEYSTGRPYHEGDTNRYLSRYLDLPNRPLYPFGHGLSYTDFEISEPVLSVSRMRLTDLQQGEKLKISVWISNTGKVTGTETVQLYLQDVVSRPVRPVRELRAFSKAELKPGERKLCVFELSLTDFEHLNEENVRACDPGEFRIYVGNSSETGNSAEFSVFQI